LKGGEAEDYEGVKIEWIRGKEAVMHIYEDGEEIEKVKLFDLKKRKEMHALFEEKGFQKKTQEEKIQQPKLRQTEKEIVQLESLPIDNMMATYVSLTMFALVIIRLVMRSRSARKSRRATGKRTAQIQKI
jgi:hypothetical protein